MSKMLGALLLCLYDNAWLYIDRTNGFVSYLGMKYTHITAIIQGMPVNANRFPYIWVQQDTILYMDR